MENGRQTSSNNLTSKEPHPQPCVGEYTHLSPSLDRDIMQRVKHIPVRAGSVVFWDNRIPHGNSYRNDPPAANDIAIAANGNGDGEASFSDVLGTSGSRAVVYCSFLPDVPINRTFVQRQLEDWKMQRAPRVGDRWIRQDDEKEDGDEAGPDGSISEQLTGMEACCLSDLGKRLIGQVAWT